MANLEQSGSWNPEAWSVKLTFSLIVNFVLQEIKIKLRHFLHSSHTITFSRCTIFDKKYKKCRHQ